MKRVALFLVIALAAAAITFRSAWLPGFGPAPIYLGYVEGETLLIAAPVAGRLVARPVTRGQTIASGARLFQIDPAAAEAQIAQADAVLSQSRAQLQNLRTGKRDIEQDIVRAQRREAEATYRLAGQELTRNAQLAASNTISRAAFDQARAAYDQAGARVQELTALEQSGDLGGRDQEIAAAEANVAAMQASLAQARVRLADLGPTAPVDALVENTFYDTGEYVQAGQPVVSLLSPEKIKLRFFVPESDIARARPGATIAYRCDGCAPDQHATIIYVAPRAEYTPPVIYSEAARQKLVFLVEAKPTGPAPALRPGLPVEVAPLAP